MSQQLERRMTVDYVKLKFPGKPVIFNARLGPLPEEVARINGQALNPRMFSVLNRYADALVNLGDSLVLIECKIEDEAGAIGQLMLYESLVSTTPELGQFRGLPVKKLLVTARPSMSLKKFALTQGVDVDFYSPMYLSETLIGRDRRRRN